VAKKTLERLLFAQGGQCFFCKKTMTRSEASVEHLLSSSRGGTNNDNNCVVCCKTLNSLFGNMTVKEKIQIVLNQTGKFECPNTDNAK